MDETVRKRTEHYDSLVEKLSAECDRTSLLLDRERSRRIWTENDNERLRDERLRFRQMIRHIVAARIKDDDKDITSLMNMLRDDDEEKAIVKLTESPAPGRDGLAG